MKRKIMPVALAFVMVFALVAMSFDSYGGDYGTLRNGEGASVMSVSRIISNSGIEYLIDEDRVSRSEFENAPFAGLGIIETHTFPLHSYEAVLAVFAEFEAAAGMLPVYEAWVEDGIGLAWVVSPMLDYDRNGNTKIPFVFEHALPIDNNRVFAKYNGRYGILDVRLTSANLQALIVSPPANDYAPINVSINGQQLSFAGQNPAIVDGRTLVPVRGVFEALGFDVNWNASLQQATLTRGGDVVIITVGSDAFTTNCVYHTLDVSAQIIGGSTMLPIRAVLESVGYYVEWDATTNTVLISQRLSNISNIIYPDDKVVDGRQEAEAFIRQFRSLFGDASVSVDWGYPWSDPPIMPHLVCNATGVEIIDARSIIYVMGHDESHEPSYIVADYGMFDLNNDGIYKIVIWYASLFANGWWTPSELYMFIDGAYRVVGQFGGFPVFYQDEHGNIVLISNEMGSARRVYTLSMKDSGIEFNFIYTLYGDVTIHTVPKFSDRTWTEIERIGL